MTIALFSLLIFYFLYYLGMISYDLFLKKPSSQLTPAHETQFVLSPETVDDSPEPVGVDDADFIVTPSFFETDLEPVSDSTTAEDAETVLETLRDQFDEENKLADVDLQIKSKSVSVDAAKEESEIPTVAKAVEPDVAMEDVEELRDLFEDGGTINEPLPNSKSLNNGTSNVAADPHERKDRWARQLWLAAQRITCVQDMGGEKVFALHT